jgi:hypothetical protein
VCAIFAGDTPWQSHYIYYVWDRGFPLDARGSSSGLLNRTKVLVVENSAGGQGSAWVSEERDVIADYKMLFGKMPEHPFKSVCVMSDSDGTHTETAAEFRNLRLLKVLAGK